jgi:tagaturonate reductase
VADLPERVLFLGTGMLLRSLCAAAVDATNRKGAWQGGIVATESGTSGRAELLNRAGGRFTLIERGLERGLTVNRSTTITSLTRVLRWREDYQEVLALVAQPQLQVIVTNTSEAGFPELPARLAPLLRHRAEQLPHAPPLLVIPTELIPENGKVLARAIPAGPEVHFCSSLVDRITTANGLLTIAEPYALWAIEGDPDVLHQIFPIDDGERVIFARDISLWRDRKLYLLNAAHTAMAPLALKRGVGTVYQATKHAELGPLFHQILFDELVPASGLPGAAEFAVKVWDRFRNPFLEHEWRVIAANQTEKVRLRVLPMIGRYVERFGKRPKGLSQCLQA